MLRLVLRNYIRSPFCTGKDLQKSNNRLENKLDNVKGVSVPANTNVVES